MSKAFNQFLLTFHKLHLSEKIYSQYKISQISFYKRHDYPLEISIYNGFEDLQSNVRLDISKIELMKNMINIYG